MRLSPVPMLNWLGTAYVNVVRNTPLTLIILFCSFGLAQTLGITLVDSKSLTSIEDSNFRLAVRGFPVYTAAVVGVDVQAESADHPSATSVSCRYHSARLGVDRVDEEHHDRIRDWRGGGRVVDEDDDRERGGAALHRRHLHGRVRHFDAPDGAVLRLAG